MLTSAITSSANLLLEVEGGALQQHPQQLVRVPGEAVRPRHALEPPQPRRAGHQQAAAPRSLHADTGNTGRGCELVLQKVPSEGSLARRRPLLMTFASRTQFHVERLWGQRPFSIVS